MFSMAGAGIRVDDCLTGSFVAAMVARESLMLLIKETNHAIHLHV